MGSLSLARPSNSSGQLVSNCLSIKAWAASMSSSATKQLSWAYVTDAGRIEITRQPLPAVDANLHVERKPGLESGVHESELRMLVVVVIMQALCKAVLKFELVCLFIAVNLVGVARLDATPHTDQALANAVACHPFLNELALVLTAAVQVGHWSPSVLRPACSTARQSVLVRSFA